MLCASVLVAYFLERLWELRDGPAEERRATLSVAARSLLAVVLAFAAGMAILVWRPHALAPGQITASPRVLDSIRLVGQASPGRVTRRRTSGCVRGLYRYAVLGALVLLPLGRRFGRGAALFLASCPPLMVVLLISSAGYGFRHLAWPPRLATFLALALACIAVAAPASRSPADGLRVLPGGDHRRPDRALLGAPGRLPRRGGCGTRPGRGSTSWRSRRSAGTASPRSRRTRSPSFVASRRACPEGCRSFPIPAATPSSTGSRSFSRVRVRRAAAPAARGRSFVRRGQRAHALSGARAGGLVVEAECSLLPLLKDCGQAAAAFAAGVGAFDPRGSATVPSP